MLEIYVALGLVLVVLPLPPGNRTSLFSICLSLPRVPPTLVYFPHIPFYWGCGFNTAFTAKPLCAVTIAFVSQNRRRKAVRFSFSDLCDTFIYSVGSAFRAMSLQVILVLFVKVVFYLIV